MALTHVYQRQVDLEPSSNDSLSIIFSKISENSLVLDVGAGAGALGRALKERKRCRVHGISYNPDEVEILKQHYDLALQVDLEQDDLPSEIKTVQYDFVVCADVLEHLKNAQEVLRRLTGLLKPEGRLIFSVPNISHVSIVISLLNGRFPRTHEGLLDSTHVNFFERSSLTQFCKDAGVSVVDQDAVYRDVARTEFSNIHSTGLPSTVQQYVEQLPDAGVYQFIWTVQRAFEADSAVPVSISYPARPEFDVRARFELKLYLDFGRGFNEDDIAVGYGLYTDGVQDVQFVLPHNRGALSAWRIDWPQWPCVLEFVQIDCRDNQGRELLSWKGSWSEHVKFDQCNMLPDLGENGFPILAVSGKNAAIEMRLTSDLPVQVMNLRMGSPFRLPLDLEDRLLKRANIQRVEFDKVNVYLNQVQTKLAFLDEHVLYMVRQTGTELAQLQEKLAVLDTHAVTGLDEVQKKMAVIDEHVRYISKRAVTGLDEVQKKMAVIDEHVRYISKHAVTDLDQKYYWNALNKRLDHLDNIFVILKDENIIFPKFIKLAYRRIKGWWRGQ